MAVLGRVAAILVCEVAACGDPAAAPDALTLDAAVFVPGPNTVTLDVYSSGALYLRYRDGTGPWTEPVATTPGTYDLHITDTYAAIAVCADDMGGFDAEEIRRTFGDGASAFIDCYAPGSFKPMIPTTVTMTGQMLQPGEVSFGDYATSTVAPWDFALQVTPGIHDLIAVGSKQMLIRRDQLIASPDIVPTVDLVQDGSAYTLRQFSTNAVAGEILTSEVDLFTTNEFAFIAGTETTLHVPPAALVIPGDLQRAWVQVTTDTTWRATSVDYTNQASFSFMPLLDVFFSFGDLWVLSANWRTLPPCTDVELEVYGFNGEQRVAVSKSWIDASGVSNLAIDGRPPDYKPGWLVELGGPYFRYFIVSENHDPDIWNYRLTALDEYVNFPPSAAMDMRGRANRHRLALGGLRDDRRAGSGSRDDRGSGAVSGRAGRGRGGPGVHARWR